MVELSEALDLLAQLDVQERYRTDICGYALLALLHLDKQSEWSDATNEWIGIHGIIGRTGEYYGVAYAENSRETFRKEAIH